MKIQMCSCALKGLARPKGPVKIESTRMVSMNRLEAKLSGAVNGTAVTIKKGSKYYFVPPKSLGKPTEVPADSLTDCMNYSVGQILPERLKPAKEKAKGRK